MTRDEYREYLTERIAETEKVVFALLLASQLDHLEHDLYYLDNEGGVCNG